MYVHITRCTTLPKMECEFRDSSPYEYSQCAAQFKVSCILMNTFNPFCLHFRWSLGFVLALIANKGSIGFTPFRFNARVSRTAPRMNVDRMGLSSRELGDLEVSPLRGVKKEFASTEPSSSPLGGIHTSSEAGSGTALSNALNRVRVGYQGSPGAYSQKAVLDLLGHDVETVGYIAFEDVFDALSNDDVSYALLPIQNSLGGSIHVNYDLMLRYDFHIIAEYELKVEHCLMALPKTRMEDLRAAMSHSQALSQCQNYLRRKGLSLIDGGDTAGSAKHIAKEKMEGIAAIASRLAADTYGLEVLDSNIEDDDINFTRFLLLSKKSVTEYLTGDVPCKTSIVFSLKNQAGALHKVFSCFALRDIDLSKIESRPMNSNLLNILRHSNTSIGIGSGGYAKSEPHFKYAFYVDFLAPVLSTPAYNALAHLKELAPYVRVLGSYPMNSHLVGKEQLGNYRTDEMSTSQLLPNTLRVTPSTSPPILETVHQNLQDPQPLEIGVIGFGKFGQYISKLLVGKHNVRAMGRADFSPASKDMGIPYYNYFNHERFFEGLDIVLMSVSIVSFEGVLKSIPSHYFKGKLVVDVLSVKKHPKNVLLDTLPKDAEILCTHPMFGPDSGGHGLASLPFVYDRVRILSNEGEQRCKAFLSSFFEARCKMVEMSCEMHDELSANSQFVTHLVGRILGELDIRKSAIDTAGFQVRDYERRNLWS